MISSILLFEKRSVASTFVLIQENVRSGIKNTIAIFKYFLKKLIHYHLKIFNTFLEILKLSFDFLYVHMAKLSPTQS